MLNFIEKLDRSFGFISKRASNILEKQLVAEKESLILWVPVFFASGICTYFYMPSEVSIHYPLTFLIIFAFMAMFFKQSKSIFWFFIICFIVNLGFITTSLRAKIVDSPILAKEIKVAKVDAVIKNISIYNEKRRFILGELHIENLASENTPKLIRLTAHTKYSGAKIGNSISVSANLRPPPAPAIPDGYDFARSSYFKGIGAVGYALSDFTIKEPQSKNFSIAKYINLIRQKITDNILRNMEGDNKYIATSLITGERGGIKKDVLEDIRTAGIAHILAISGMHLSLVAGIFFILTYSILPFFTKIAVRFNPRKIAAFVAIFGSFTYLLISGMPISAQRAFIMTSMILLAIIIDRVSTPMRSMALAAMVVMVITPEAILTPSFQMSFAAVAALIASYEYATRSYIRAKDQSIFERIAIYFFGVIFSTIIASMATAPFAIYHFNHFSSYGLFTNLVAIPVTSFLIMPSAVISLFLMPINLEQIGFLPMSWGIDILVATAKYIAALPEAKHTLPSISPIAFVLIVIGFLWFTLWQDKWRKYGILIILLGGVLNLLVKAPDILIGREGEIFALKNDENKWLFSSSGKGRYVKDLWLRNLGEEKFFTLESLSGVNCDELGCKYSKSGYNIEIIKHPLALNGVCENSDIIINLTKVNANCKDQKQIITYWNLKKNGVHAVFLNDYDVKIVNVKDERGDRPWSN